MKLFIIIPVFNEKETIEGAIKRIITASVLNYEKEIIVVNDGSNDGTEKILKHLKKKFNFTLLEHSQNCGKGMAIRTALKKISNGLILIQDADLEYDPRDWPKLLKEMNNPKTTAIYGSRNINPKKRGYLHYVLGVKFLTFLVNLLFKSNLTDIYTCYKLFHSCLIKNILLKSKGFEFEAEITIKFLKKGISIKEVPINYYPRKFGQGKKIRFSDGLIGLWTIIKNWIK